MSSDGVLHMESPLTVRHRTASRQGWSGRREDLITEPEAMQTALLDLSAAVAVVRRNGQSALARGGEMTLEPGDVEVLASVPAIGLDQLGDPGFCRTYGTRYAYYGGSMAGAIASVEMVIALGQDGFLGAYGAAGMVPARIEAAIQKIQAALSDGPYAFNLIHSPNEPALERRAIELYLQYGVRTVEASAFLELTPYIVHYRATGLSRGADGSVEIRNRVIAKLSRKEVATKFMSPAPVSILSQLVSEGKITTLQADLAQKVPMADDVTVEADSGGHTDNRPLVVLLPTMLALRDELQAKYAFAMPVRVGAAGGISTPSAALGAFMMGAAFVATGSINQACVEAGTSDYVRSILAKADMADVIMAPSADMFEMGVKVQVLRTGTMFAMRAQKLYDLYVRYDSLEAIPADERQKLEKQIFKREIDSIWEDTVKYFMERDPETITRAQENPKRRMALVFRWYIGLSSRWASSGEKGREMDYQIWCGPAMGAFNEWTRGTPLADPANRHVAEVASQILTGATYLYRVQQLRLQGVELPAAWQQYRPAV